MALTFVPLEKLARAEASARNGEEMTENDTNCMLQDLIDLGVIDEDGNLK